jgi:hypothetical protein
MTFSGEPGCTRTNSIAPLTTTKKARPARPVEQHFVRPHRAALAMRGDSCDLRCGERRNASSVLVMPLAPDFCRGNRSAIQLYLQMIPA